MSTRTTLRSQMVDAIIQDLAAKAQPDDFLIPSEHQLCRRFNISRVTVRLALGDLEAKGFIYRKHGKGTYAFGQSRLEPKSIAIFCRSSETFSSWPISEFLRGINSVREGHLQTVVLQSLLPQKRWSEAAKNIGGLVVLENAEVQDDIEYVKNLGIPCLALEANGVDSTVSVGIAKSAQVMTKALLISGHQRYALLASKDLPWLSQIREAMRQAFVEVGLDSDSMLEINAEAGDKERLDAVAALFQSRPYPTAIVATDDSLATLVHHYARRYKNLSVPGDVSIVSLCEYPYFAHLEPRLTTVQLRFFEAGQHAAKALNQAYMTNQAVAEAKFEPVFRQGSTTSSANHRQPEVVF